MYWELKARLCCAQQTSNSEKECDWEVSGSPMQESLLYERSKEWTLLPCAWSSSWLLGQGRWEAVVSLISQGHESMGWFWFWFVCFEIGSLCVVLAILALAV